MAIIVILVTAVISLPAYMIYSNTRRLVINQVAKNAMNVASTTAAFLESDSGSYRALSEVGTYAPGTYDEAYYSRMLELFRQVKAETGADFVYTEKAVSATGLAYILDGEEPGSELFSAIGSTDVLVDAERKALAERVATSSGIIEDEQWGVYLSGFAPITDPESGDVLGLVGVDFSLASIRSILSNLAVIVLTGALVLIVVATAIMNRLINLRFAAMETDYLTGLFSKHYHEQQLHLCTQEAATLHKPVSLIMIDVDFFKQINDKYGHVIGDRVLKAVAEVIRTNTRSVDRCSRFGGDEFVVILPDTRKDYAATISERIKEKVLEQNIEVAGADPIPITLSIGVAEWSPGMGAEELTACADKAMYVSKNTGKNKVTMHVATTTLG